MKYKDPITGEYKELFLKASDTLPIGTIVEYDGDTVPDGYEEVDEGFKRTLLWENPNPNVSFDPQNIELSSDDYDELVLYYKFYQVSDFCKSLNTLKGHGAAMDYAYDFGVSGVFYEGCYHRNIIRNSDTSFRVDTCYINYNGDKATTNNAYLIPIAVYGIRY